MACHSTDTHVMHVYRMCMAGFGSTAARAGNHQGVVVMLLAAGADADQADNEGTTPLYWAVGGGHNTVVMRLLAAGADVDHPDRKVARASSSFPCARPALHAKVCIVTVSLFCRGTRCSAQPRAMATRSWCGAALERPPHAHWIPQPVD